MPAGVKSMSFVWSSPSSVGASSRATCIVVPQPHDASSLTSASSRFASGICLRQLADDVAQVVDLLLPRDVAVGAARELDVLLPPHHLPDRLGLGPVGATR